MERGTIKWFSNLKGYGFITPDNGGADVFVHYSNVQMEGYKQLFEHDRVQYQLIDGRGGEPAAINVRVTR